MVYYAPRFYFELKGLVKKMEILQYRKRPEANVPKPKYTVCKCIRKKYSEKFIN